MHVFIYRPNTTLHAAVCYPEVFGRVRENMQNNRVQQHLAEMAIPVALEATDGGVEKRKKLW